MRNKQQKSMQENKDKNQQKKSNKNKKDDIREDKERMVSEGGHEANDYQNQKK